MSNFLTNLTPIIYAASSDPVNIVTEALRWVITALTTIGALLVVISLIRTGIKMANAESPEEQQKCKKKIIYSIIGLVLIVSALTVVNVLTPFIKEWLGNNVSQ